MLTTHNSLVTCELTVIWWFVLGARELTRIRVFRRRGTVLIVFKMSAGPYVQTKCIRPDNQATSIYASLPYVAYYLHTSHHKQLIQGR